MASYILCKVLLVPYTGTCADVAVDVAFRRRSWGSCNPKFLGSGEANLVRRRATEAAEIEELGPLVAPGHRSARGMGADMRMLHRVLHTVRIALL
jgi:hypothetical protein